MTHLAFSLLFFALGASVGSFLNVVVWRVPRGKSLVSPPSHCPACGHRLSMLKDNIPVLGWFILRGRCRYCAQPISIRYPAVELFTGLLFVFYYLMFFVAHASPCAPLLRPGEPDIFGRIPMEPAMMRSIFQDTPVYLLLMFMMASLVAVTLIDAELYIIPLGIPWLMAAVGIFVHTIIDRPTLPGAVNLTDPRGISSAIAAGGGIGLLVTILLYRSGLIPQSFPQGEPLLEIEEAQKGPPGFAVVTGGAQPAPEPEGLMLPPPPKMTPAEIRAEMRKEMLFLTPPMLGALLLVALTQLVPPIRDGWRSLMQYHWLTGMLGAVLGALVGAFIVWIARILGTLGFGRISMGLGDVHLMFGVGAIIGAGPSAVAFFLAPFAGICVGLYMWLTRNRHELPYGPYLSLATGVVLLVYCPIAEYLRPGFEGLAAFVRNGVGG
jgi:leader peptidase (prepilin peptidase) / N-methyltransferase